METINDKDHLYTLVEVKPYTRRDGTSTSLDVWEALCTYPGCTVRYTVSVPHGYGPDKSKAFGTRRCADHKMNQAERTEKWQAAIKASRERKKSQIRT